MYYFQFATESPHNFPDDRRLAMRQASLAVNSRSLRGISGRFRGIIVAVIRWRRRPAPRGLGSCGLAVGSSASRLSPRLTTIKGAGGSFQATPMAEVGWKADPSLRLIGWRP